jgi:hypothetical protein
MGRRLDPCREEEGLISRTSSQYMQRKFYKIHGLLACVHPPTVLLVRRRVRLDLASSGRTGLKHFLTDIEEASPKCYSRIRPSCSCEAIWDGIDRTREAPPRK